MTSQSNRHVTLQARGYLRKKGYLRLGAVLAQCATLYNAALQERRDAHRMNGLSISQFDQIPKATPTRGENAPSTPATAEE